MVARSIFISHIGSLYSISCSTSRTIVHIPCFAGCIGLIGTPRTCISTTKLHTRDTIGIGCRQPKINNSTRSICCSSIDANWSCRIGSIQDYRITKDSGIVGIIGILNIDRLDSISCTTSWACCQTSCFARCRCLWQTPSPWVTRKFHTRYTISITIGQSQTHRCSTCIHNSSIDSQKTRRFGSIQDTLSHKVRSKVTRRKELRNHIFGAITRSQEDSRLGINCSINSRSKHITKHTISTYLTSRSQTCHDKSRSIGQWRYWERSDISRSESSDIFGTISVTCNQFQVIEPKDRSILEQDTTTKTIRQRKSRGKWTGCSERKCPSREQIYSTRIPWIDDILSFTHSKRR